jgi:hypothetical protein
MRITSLLCSCGMILATTSPALAQGPKSTYWQADPTRPGQWFEAKNWTAGLPGSCTWTYVDNGGTVEMPNSMLTVCAVAGMLYVGDTFGGAVEQKGMTLVVSSDVYLSRYGRGRASYDLLNGMVLAANVYVGSGPPWDATMGPIAPGGGRFTQTGGVCVIGPNASAGGALYVGYREYPPTPLDEGPAVLAAEDDASRYGPCALYELAGGKLSAGTTLVGLGGPGRFVQSAGTHTVAGSLDVGGGLCTILDAGSAATDPAVVEPWPAGYQQGIYELSGGVLTARGVHVGQWGRGRFAQWGGEVSVEGFLQVGGNWWWWPYAANPDGGQEMEMMSSACVPEFRYAAQGAYMLSAGTLKALHTEVGVGGSGWFSQSGGEHLVAGTLRVGGQSYWPVLTDGNDLAGAPSIWPPSPGPGRGSYTMSGGVLSAGRIEIGAGYTPWLNDVVAQDPAAGGAGWTDPALIAPWLAATFRQVGGDVKAAGELSIHGGSYEMTGGTVSAAGVFLAGRYKYDSSTFRQTGGTVCVCGGLIVGGQFYADRQVTDAERLSNALLPWPACESYTLGGGQLRAASVRVVGAGRDTLRQYGGEMFVDGTVEIAGPCAAWYLDGGVAAAARVQVGRPANSPQAGAPGGLLCLGGPRASLTVRDALTFGPDGRFTAAPGSTVLMRGADFKNYSRDPLALAGLDDLRLVFTGGPDGSMDWATYEVAGKDLGFVRQGWWQNFQMHTLQVGAEEVGRLRLVDEFDNQPGYDREALYVRYLRVGSGSLLDLNGLNLYYLDGEIASDAVMLGGQPERIASPAWALPCDLDLDGSVGLGDLAKLAANFGSSMAGGAEGDFNGDGRVDSLDYVTLKRNFGVVSPNGSGAIPEPAGLALPAAGGTIPEPAGLALLAAGSAILLQRRRRPAVAIPDASCGSHRPSRVQKRLLRQTIQ